MYVLALAICCLAMGAIAYASKSATASSSNLYGKVSAMTPAEAKAEYAKLTPSERREVWRQKLLSIDSRQMTKDQAAFVKSVVSQLSGFKFDKTDDALKLEAIRVRSVELFGFSTAQSLFASLGKSDKLKATKASLYFAPCGCSTNQNWCDDEYTCSQLGGCNITWFCGTLWTQSCDGRCWPTG